MRKYDENGQIIMDDRLFTAREAAIILRVHVNTVKRLIKRGELQGYRFGSRGDIRIGQKHIDAYLENAET